MTGAHCHGHVGFIRAMLRIGVASRRSGELRAKCRSILDRLGLG